MWGKTASLNYHGNYIIIILKDYKYFVLEVQSDLKKGIWTSFIYLFNQDLLAISRPSAALSAIDSEMHIRVSVLDLLTTPSKSRTPFLEIN